MRWKEKIRQVVQDGRGVTSIEYGLIASLIAVVIIVALQNTKQSVVGTYNKVDTAITNANGGN